ncbi:hypothetical protein [Burkholderia perseverans]|uniref:hypothetical protein n=1 Tax=Burkholderia perseverans TaxID=2615214 RepID=UPI001FF00692|nr:hypothetical protein [Burkholderia perseverans]
MSAFLQGLFNDPEFVAQIEDGIRDRLIGQETDLDHRDVNWDPPATITDATVTELDFTPGDSPDSSIEVTGRANVTVHYIDSNDENSEHEITLDGDVMATISLDLPDDVTDDSDAEDFLDDVEVDWDADDVTFSPDVEGEEPPEDDYDDEDGPRGNDDEDERD